MKAMPAADRDGERPKNNARPSAAARNISQNPHLVIEWDGSVRLLDLDQAAISPVALARKNAHNGLTSTVRGFVS
jgi:hypothetical protein